MAKARLLLLLVSALALDAAARFKAALTQKGYIQYLRYKVDVPDLDDFTFCLWLRSENFTNPQPIFSYARDERERLARGWLEASAGAGEGVAVALAVREVPIMRQRVPLRAGRWHHLCQAWRAPDAAWSLHLDGRLFAAGRAPHARGVVAPGGGEVAVGQELTDVDRGLDDGVEGEVFGFNLVAGGGDAAGSALAAAACSGTGALAPGSAPGFAPGFAPGGGRVLVAWDRTPVAVFGGAVLLPVRPLCAHF